MSNLTHIARLPEDGLTAPTAIPSQSHSQTSNSVPHPQTPILSLPDLSGAQLLARVANAVTDLCVRFPTLDFHIKPDGGLVISIRATGKRVTDCPYPYCDKGISNKRSNCVSRHFQSTHAPQTLPFVCGGTCSSKTNRRDHFIAHLKRNNARCAAYLLANASDPDVATMMRVVYPASKELSWEVALVRDTNPVHVDAQLRKRGTSLEAIIPGAMSRTGMVGYAIPSSAQTPVVFHSRQVLNQALPNLPTREVVQSTQALSPTSDLDSLFATPPAALQVVAHTSLRHAGASDTLPPAVAHTYPSTPDSWSAPSHFSSQSVPSNSATMATTSAAGFPWSQQSAGRQHRAYAHMHTSHTSHSQAQSYPQTPMYPSSVSHGSQYSAPQQPWHSPSSRGFVHPGSAQNGLSHTPQ